MSMITSMSLLGMMSAAAGKLGSDELKALDMNDLMDVAIDEIEELPEFVTPPRGYYELAIPKIEQRTIETSEGDVETLVLTFSVVRCIEKDELQAKEKELPDVQEGAMFTQNFMQGAGIQRLLKLFGSVVQQNNCKTLRELLAILPTINVNAVVKHRYAKDDRKTKETPFTDLSDITQA